MIRLYTREDVLTVAGLRCLGDTAEQALAEAERLGMLTTHDPALCAALSHPLRGRILAHMHTNGVETSPMQIAGALGEPLGNVSYHVRKLQKQGMIKLTKTKPRRGAVEHFYQLT